MFPASLFRVTCELFVFDLRPFTSLLSFTTCLVAPQVEHDQVGEQSQLGRKNRQIVERQIQLLQL